MEKNLGKTLGKFWAYLGKTLKLSWENLGFFRKNLALEKS
jgi:hypothetical protein